MDRQRGHRRHRLGHRKYGPHTGAEGKPPHEIQPVGILADFKLDELPEQLRFLGWATYTETETAIVVTAERPGADPLLLGSWPRSVWLEYVRRFYEAGGD